MSAALARTFSSLAVPNYRRYFTGQLASLSGNWMQMVAEIWLILTLTGSGVAVGFTTALQFLPMLLVGAWAGALADRVDKRRLLMITQTLHMLPPLALFGLAVSGAATAEGVYALVFARGLINAFDHPTRQAFVMELVGPKRIVNAVSLGSVLVHSARIVGPAIAGVLIATVGVAPCFALNAASFAVMLVALAAIDVRALEPRAPAAPRAGAVRAGVREVRSTPELWIPLAMMAVVGTLGFNFLAILPLLARFSFDGGPATYAALVSAMGVGAVLGGLIAGARSSATPALLVGSALAFGIFALLAAAAPTVPLEILALVPLGGAAVTLAVGISSSLQLTAAPSMRGRVMALYSVVFLGSTPIGGPFAGWLSEAADPRAALVVAGASALAAATFARVAYARLPGDAATAAAQAQPQCEGVRRSPALEPTPLGTPRRDTHPDSPGTSGARSAPAVPPAAAPGRRSSAAPARSRRSAGRRRSAARRR